MSLTSIRACSARIWVGLMWLGLGASVTAIRPPQMVPLGESHEVPAVVKEVELHRRSKSRGSGYYATVHVELPEGPADHDPSRRLIAHDPPVVGDHAVVCVSPIRRPSVANFGPCPTVRGMQADPNAPVATLVGPLFGLLGVTTLATLIHPRLRPIAPARGTLWTVGLSLPVLAILLMITVVQLPKMARQAEGAWRGTTQMATLTALSLAPPPITLRVDAHLDSPAGPMTIVGTTFDAPAGTSFTVCFDEVGRGAWEGPCDRVVRERWGTLAWTVLGSAILATMSVLAAFLLLTERFDRRMGLQQEAR